MVADTDRGWFTWSQSAVALTRATYTSTHATFRTRWVVADSPQMVVQFPEPVSVRHAWVTTAQTHGEANFNWDSFGEVACDPPPFGAPAGAKELGSTNRDQAAGDPTPAPAPPSAIAAPTSPPFPIPTCDHPFVAATVTKVVQPDYPQSMKEDAWNVTASQKSTSRSIPTGTSRTRGFSLRPAMSSSTVKRSERRATLSTRRRCLTAGRSAARTSFAPTSVPISAPLYSSFPQQYSAAGRGVR